MSGQTIAHLLLADAWFVYGAQWAERGVYLITAFNSATCLCQAIARQIAQDSEPCELALTARVGG